jgi:hypothetical protein
MYCASAGLTKPTGYCTEGYYCRGGSTVATPFESGESKYRVSYIGDTCLNGTKENDVCPAGHYCPKGSISPVPCPAGTNSSSQGLTSVKDCPACVQGYYCPDEGTVHATLLCLAGYYCPSGSNSSKLVCPTGSVCQTGSWEPTVCRAGYYQDSKQASVCKVIFFLYFEFLSNC